MDGASSYISNKVYKNRKYNIYYFVNTQGYMHILKPCTVKMGNRVLYYSIEDFLLSQNDMLQSKGWSGEFSSIQQVVEELERRVAQ